MCDGEVLQKKMEEIYRVWRFEENEALLSNVENIDETLSSVSVGGKNFREDFMAYASTLGVAVHPGVVPRTKSISDFTEEDKSSPASLFDTSPVEGEISIRGTAVDRATLHCLCKAISAGSSISSLKLVDIDLTSESFRILASELPAMSSLTSLCVDFNTAVPRSADFAQLILPASSGTTLARLSLRGCNVDDAGAGAISQALWINSSITHLNLYNNRISETGGAHLAKALRYNHVLQCLWLGRNSTGNKTAALFASGLSTYGPLTSAEKEERTVVEQLHAENAGKGGGGKKGKGGGGGGAFSLDALDEETGMCTGNQTFKCLDLTQTSINAKGMESLLEIFSSEETVFSPELKQFAVNGGKNQSVVDAIDKKLGRVTGKEE